MNKTINKYLLIIFSLFLCIGIANAETDYKTVCKGKTGDELITCCSGIETREDEVACRESAFKKCGQEKGLSAKTKCCSNFSDFEALMDCNSYVKGLCTSTDSVEVSKAAMKVKIVYEPVDVVNPNNANETYYMMDIKVYNLPADMLLKVDTSEGNTYMVDAKSANKEGIITLRSADTSEVKKI